MSNIRKISGNPGDTWDDLSWTDMNDVEQALWATLGWNEASWEEEGGATGRGCDAGVPGGVPPLQAVQLPLPVLLRHLPRPPRPAQPRARPDPASNRSPTDYDLSGLCLGRRAR